MTEPLTTLVPATLRTERLLLRHWRPEDAPRLHDALAPSVAHLEPWIPWTVAEPAPVPELERRLARFAEAIEARREWHWAILDADTDALLGGISLHPRDAHARVPFDAADRVEIGYWLHVGATGHGYATEAVRAVLAAARALPHVAHVEIHCDPRNAPSAAIPRRLGFRHAHTQDGMMVWEHPA